MSVKLFVEGGGESKELHVRCREAFCRVLEKAGFVGRMPRIVACGGRNAAYGDFCTALEIARCCSSIANRRWQTRHGPTWKAKTIGNDPMRLRTTKPS